MCRFLEATGTASRWALSLVALAGLDGRGGQPTDSRIILTAGKNRKIGLFALLRFLRNSERSRHRVEKSQHPMMAFGSTPGFMC
jgi:hypothetical protein